MFSVPNGCTLTRYFSFLQMCSGNVTFV